jgi:hypothetical protein
MSYWISSAAIVSPQMSHGESSPRPPQTRGAADRSGKLPSLSKRVTCSRISACSIVAPSLPNELEHSTYAPIRRAMQVTFVLISTVMGDHTGENDQSCSELFLPDRRKRLARLIQRFERRQLSVSRSEMGLDLISRSRQPLLACRAASPLESSIRYRGLIHGQVRQVSCSN